MEEEEEDEEEEEEEEERRERSPQEEGRTILALRAISGSTCGSIEGFGLVVVVVEDVEVVVNVVLVGTSVVRDV